MEITPQTSIETITELGPELVRYLSEQGIRCVICGEPIWGTLEEAAREKGFGIGEINEFVAHMNGILMENGKL